jgi:Ca-activated chloride channel family protein
MKGKIIVLFSLILCAFALVPSRKISGRVTNTDLKPIKEVQIIAKGTSVSTNTDSLGNFTIHVPVYAKVLVFNFEGYFTKEVRIDSSTFLNVVLDSMKRVKEELADLKAPISKVKKTEYVAEMSTESPMSVMSVPAPARQRNAESYKIIHEKGFQNAEHEPVTTFSADVDRAAYSNIRRFLNAGHMPPVDAVRIEEMINYFDYNYAQPNREHPLSLKTELTDSPWNPGLKLLHIGLQAKSVSSNDLPASNLVFLIDVSGSMSDENKLPLLQQAFKLLADQLRPQDKISIVAYAGAAGVVLPPTAGNEQIKIREALDNLEAGGSTAGGEGIELAYSLAKKNFIPKGNNRVILATDGDFNVGISSEGDLERLIAEKRKDGIFLSVMGFGMGNYKDSQMETLADKGNGNYAYIDNIQEARKEFVQEFGGTLFTVAKDVKFQIEFNPDHVQAYRLIGYENRALQNEDFNNDKKDAGEMGTGHTVTALYEIIPAGIKSNYISQTDALKYQKNTKSVTEKSDEILTLKIRYKNPDEEKSRLFDLPVKNTSIPFSAASENLRFAASVAEFGLLLRNSEFKGNASYQNVIQRAKSALGKDEEGYRSEFVKLAKTAQLLDNKLDNKTEIVTKNN